MSNPNKDSYLDAVDENFKNFSISSVLRPDGLPADHQQLNNFPTFPTDNSSGFGGPVSYQANNFGSNSGTQSYANSGWEASGADSRSGWGGPPPIPSRTTNVIPPNNYSNTSAATSLDGSVSSWGLPGPKASAHANNDLPPAYSAGIANPQSSPTTVSRGMHNTSWSSHNQPPAASFNHGSHLHSDIPPSSLRGPPSVNPTATEKNCIYPFQYNSNVQLYFFPETPEAMICVGCFNTHFVPYNAAHLVQLKLVYRVNEPRCSFNTDVVKSHWYNKVLRFPNNKNYYYELLLLLRERNALRICPRSEAVAFKNETKKVYTMVQFLTDENCMTVCEGCYHDYGKFSNLKNNFVRFPPLENSNYACDFADAYVLRLFRKCSSKNNATTFYQKYLKYLNHTPACGLHKVLYKSTYMAPSVGFCEQCFMHFFGETNAESQFFTQASTEKCINQHVGLKFKYNREIELQNDLTSFLSALSFLKLVPACKAGAREGVLYKLAGTDFDMCEFCYYYLVKLFDPALERFFVTHREPILCDLNLRNPATYKNLYKLFESLYYEDFNVLKNHLRSFEALPPCPKSNAIVGKWYNTINWTISLCEFCYQSNVASTAFSSHFRESQDTAARKCDFFYTQYQQQWLDVLEMNDFSRLEGYVSLQKAHIKLIEAQMSADLAAVAANNAPAVATTDANLILAQNLQAQTQAMQQVQLTQLEINQKLQSQKRTGSKLQTFTKVLETGNSVLSLFAGN